MSLPASRPVPPVGASALNLRGAVDLSAFKQRPGPPAGATAGPPGSAPAHQGTDAAANPSLRVEVTEKNFQELVELSAQVPVVFALWAGYSPESAAMLEVLERVINGYGGRLVLGTADVEAFPQLAQAFQVEAVPTAVAVVKGQPVPLFQGGADENQLPPLLDELLKVAAANGVTGAVGGASQDDPQEEAPLPPLHQAAYDAIETGDYEAAAAAYRQALLEAPADTLAKEGLAQVGLMARVQPLTAQDTEALRQQGADEPDNLDVQLSVADLDVSGGHVEDALNRLVAFIGRNFGPERETARLRLLELFDVVGVTDDRVAKARQGLARVLF